MMERNERKKERGKTLSEKERPGERERERDQPSGFSQQI